MKQVIEVLNRFKILFEPHAENHHIFSQTGITKDTLFQKVHSWKAMLEHLDTSIFPNQKAGSEQAILSIMNQLVSHLTNFISQPAHLQNYINSLNQFNATIAAQYNQYPSVVTASQISTIKTLETNYDEVIEEFQSSLRAAKQYSTQFAEQKEKIKSWDLDIDGIFRDRSDTLNQYNETLGEIELIQQKIKLIFEESRKYKNQISSGVTRANGLQETGETLKNSLDGAIRNSEQSQKQIETFLAKLQSTTDHVETKRLAHEEVYENLKEQVENLIQRAGSSELASSFKDRYKAARMAKWFWASVFFISIGLFIALPWLLPFEEKSWFSIDPKQIPLKLPFIGAIIWLGWIANKNQGVQARIVEDYAYKHAIALTYYSFRSQADKSDDPSLALKLLDESIKHFSLNPLRVFEDNHASPVEALLSKSKKTRTNTLKQHSTDNETQKGVDGKA